MENIDFKVFFDAGNVWGVDYSDTVDESNKIRTSTGVALELLTPVGPLLSLQKQSQKHLLTLLKHLDFNLAQLFNVQYIYKTFFIFFFLLHSHFKNITIVDVNFLIQNSKAGKFIQKTLNDDNKKIIEELNKKGNELKNEEKR